MAAEVLAAEVVLIIWLGDKYVKAESDVEDQVKEIERELRLMYAYLKHVEALESLGEREKGMADEMTEIAQNAKDVIDTFFLKKAQRRRNGIFGRPFSDMLDRYKVSNELTRVKSAINGLLNKRKIYGISSSTTTSRPSQGGGSMSRMLSDLIQKFEILTHGNYHLDRGNKKNVARVANECKHLLWLLKDMELVEEDERLKIWMKDIEDLVLFALQVIGSFMEKRDKQIKSECRIFAGAIPNFSFSKKIQLIEGMIQEALRRKLAYGIGDIKGKKALSSTVPNLKLERKQRRNYSKMDSYFKPFLSSYQSVLLAIGERLESGGNLRGRNVSQEQVEDEVESFCRDLRLMRALLDDIKTIEDPDGILNAWVEEVTDVANDADSIIDTYINKTNYIGFKAHISVRTTMNRIRKTIDTLSERRTYYGIKHYGQKRDFDSIIQMQHPSLPAVHPTHTIGFDEDVKAIIKELLSKDQGRCVICIVGMKATDLAKDIYKNTVDHFHFPSRAFVSVPQVPIPTEIQEEIVQQVIESQKLKAKSIQGENPQNQLIDLLTNIRYFVVLDLDAVQYREDTWDKLKDGFPDTPGSIVVLTTRDTKLDSIADWDSSKKSLTIFLPTEALISEERSTTLDGLNRDENPCLEMSSVINTELPLYMWRCLLYFESFPAKFEIPPRRLIALWVAEGLVLQKEGDEEPPEYVAQRYLAELIDRKIVQVKKKVNGKVRTCQLFPDTRDFWLSRAKKDMVLPRSESSLSIGKIRRLADHLDKEHPSFNHIHSGNNIDPISLQSHYRNLLSFLSFDTQEGSKPGEDVQNFLYQCISSKCLQFLRVLDLEGVFRPKLPKEVGKLILLRYLGLRWTHLETLPSFISNLLNLQTLDLKHTSISTLPKSIWKMQQLRHLYLNEVYRTRFVPRPRDGSLKTLQTLWGVFIDKKIRVEGSLAGVKNLTKLGLACRFMSSQTEETLSQLVEVANWVLELEHLQSLRLRSHNELNQPWDLHLNSLSRLSHLSTINLLGRLTNPDVVTDFPQSLTELTLSATELSIDPMGTLDKLPNLKILRLFSKSYVGNTMKCTSGGFPQLQVLNIWKLEQQVDWSMEKGALPTLTNLEIRSCIGLKMLPDGLQHVRTLGELKLTKMPDEFKARSKASLGDDWQKIARLLKEDCQN